MTANRAIRGLLGVFKPQFQALTTEYMTIKCLNDKINIPASGSDGVIEHLLTNSAKEVPRDLSGLDELSLDNLIRHVINLL